MRTMLKSKIHRVRVSGTNLDYEGSITIDRNLLKSADILPYEKVEVLNLNNAARFETYAIPGEEGEITINGPAARLVAKGDIILILSYITVPEEKAVNFQPKLVFVDENNRLLTRA